jgi:hypothetical protein
LAAEMLANGEVDSVSVAYHVADLKILDLRGRLVDPRDTDRSNEAGLTFEATKFEIYELSLVRGDDQADTDDDVVDGA